MPVVYVLAGNSSPLDTDMETYGSVRKHFLTRRRGKNSVVFDGRPPIQHIVQRHYEAGAEMIHVSGGRALDGLLGPYLPRVRRRGTARQTIGDRLREVPEVAKQHPGEPVVIATNDMVPEVPQLRSFYDLVDSMGHDLALLYPFVDGNLLLRDGFRKHLGHKMYMLRREGGTIDYNAFSSVTAVRPEHIRWDVVGKVADMVFGFRNLGSTVKLLTKIKFSEDALSKYGIQMSDVKAMRDIMRRAQINGDETPTYVEGIRAFSCFFKDRYRVEERCRIIPASKWDSLARDYDDIEEAEKVAASLDLTLELVKTRRR